MKIGIIIPAAGFGQRFGHEVPKQYHALDQAPIIVHTLRTVLGIDSVTSVVVAVSPTDTMFDAICREHHVTDARLHTTVGGAERQHSIMNALDHVSLSDVDVILVHDAVRPLASDGLFTRVALMAFEKGACVPVITVDDTIKRVEADRVVGTVPRHDLRRAQTPQGFTPNVLRRAYNEAMRSNVLGTDDASLAEASGITVYTVDGEPWNTKITTPFDLAVAASLMARNS